MYPERPKDWTPPPREFGGEDLVEYFAFKFVQEYIGSLVRVYGVDYIPPVAQGYEEMAQIHEGVTARLIDNGHYYDGMESTLFGDYKIMRDDANVRIGINMGIEDPIRAESAGSKRVFGELRPGMTIEQALGVAREIVSSWEWWEED